MLVSLIFICEAGFLFALQKERIDLKMAKELAKQYDPKNIEDRIYDFWLKGNYFHAKMNLTKSLIQ